MTMLMAAAQATDTLATLPVTDLLIGGFVMPPAIALVNQRPFPAWAKGLVALGSCLAAAWLAELLRGPVDLSDWRATFLAIGGSAVFWYGVWWQPSGIAPWLERKTTIIGGRDGTGSVADKLSGGDEEPPAARHVRTDTHRPTVT